MTKKLLSLFLSIVTITGIAQNKDKHAILEIKAGLNHEPISGISLTDTGLWAGHVIWKRNIIFKPKMKYEHIFIAYEELDSSRFYRLMAFLAIHDYASEVRDFNNEPWMSGSPMRYYIFNPNSGVMNEIIDYYYVRELEGRNYDRYLLNEMVFLLNDLIPEKESEFRIPVIYKPKIQNITH